MTTAIATSITLTITYHRLCTPHYCFLFLLWIPILQLSAPFTRWTRSPSHRWFFRQEKYISSYVGHQVASNEASLLGVRSISFPLKRDPTSFRIRGKRGKNIQSHVCRSSFWLHGCQEQVSTKEQALIARQVFPPLPLSDPPMGVRRVLNNALLSLRGKCIKSIHTVRDKEILKNEDVFFCLSFSTIVRRWCERILNLSRLCTEQKTLSSVPTFLCLLIRKK